MKLKNHDDRQLSLFEMFDCSAAVVAEPPEDVATKSELAASIEEAYIPPKRQRSLFTLTESVLTGLTGDKAKIEANLLAIETLVDIRNERRRATEAEKTLLARYTGWGGLSGVFAGASEHQWAQERLKALLSAQEYRAAEESVLTAYYTEPHVVKAMWAMVQALGFNGGSVVEPSCGVGHFIGAMPEDVRYASKVTMVDVDPTTSDIAAALYEDEMTRCYNMGIEKTRYIGAFDLAIGNVPWGNYRVRDERLDRLKLNIHDYFIVKSLDMVRPGGLVALITTSATMDGASKQSFRDHLAQMAEIKTMVRLPAGAFARLGGTDVVADIIVLQKRNAPLEVVSSQDNPIGSCRQIPFKMIGDTSHSYQLQQRWINRYFVENPECVLGKFALGSTRWGDSVTVRASSDWEVVLAGVADGLTKSFDEELNVVHDGGRRKTDPNGVKDFVAHGFFFDEDGRLMNINERNQVEPVDQLPPATLQRLIGMTRIRDCVLRLLELDSRQSDAAEAVRQELNGLYDAFVARHGPLMGQTNQRLYRDDTHAPLLWSLEHWDDENEEAKKAEIFTRSTVSHATLADKAETIDDAIALSYNRLGRLDVDTVASYLSCEVSEVIVQLQERERIFLDPATGLWVDSLDYLSGQVRDKLRIAQAAAKRDMAFDANVEALKVVQPAVVPIQQVAVRLGVSWIGAELVEEWLRETFDIGRDGGSNAYSTLQVMHAKETASWSVTYSYPKHPQFTSEWGTSRKGFWNLLENLLHQKTPEVFDEVETETGGKRLVLNRDETIAAQEKAEKIQASFAKWLLADEVRARKAETTYNDIFNGVVNRAYDGSHLLVPGLNPAIELRQAQKDSVWRGIISGNVLFALAVGGGKTLIQIVLAQESKRLGLANKPVLMVPNHMLASFAGEYMRAFPKAKILAASKDDMQGQARGTLLMRMAVNDWDAIIMTHSTFGKISVGKERIEEMIDEVKQQARASVLGVSDRNLVREANRAALQAENVLKGLIKSDQDDGLPGFEKLGIDMVLTDEADMYKNRFFFTRKKRIPGINSSVSQRAMDLFIKSRIIFEARGDSTRGLVLSTATPISNSIGDLFIMQTYLQEARLRELGIDNFDAWSANFAREVTCVEVKPEGSGYRLHTRFASFQNVPELMLLFREIAEIRTKRQLKLPEPTLHGGGHEIVAVTPSEAQKAYVQQLVKRAEKIRNGEVRPEEDNMLCVTSDGRKAALDMRCVDPMAACDRDNKVHACIERVYEFWLAGQKEKTTQLVFSDLSVPGGVFSVYEYIHEELIRRGVPSGEIAFAQNYKTDKLKAKLHRLVRAGLIRILIGSTELMGFGTNVQDRLIAEHHLDAPWRPRDVEQRDGRIIRQGNMHESVHIIRYVTSATFDAYNWQGLERKATFIAQVMENDGMARSIEDVTSQALSFAEVKALASGNPLVIEKAAVDADVAKLTALKSVYINNRWHAKNALHWDEHELASALKQMEEYTAFLGALQVKQGYATVSNLELTPKMAAKAIMDRMAVLRTSFRASERVERVHAREETLFSTGNLVVGLYLGARARGFELRATLQGRSLATGYAVDVPYGAENIASWLEADDLLRQLSLRGENLSGRVERLKERIQEHKDRLALSFEFEAQLEQALTRKEQIDAELEIDTDDTSALALEKVE